MSYRSLLPRPVRIVVLVFFLVVALYGKTQFSKTDQIISASSNTAQGVSGTTTASVLRVVDGDTIDVSISGEKVRVRLIGINTPEIVDPRRPVECFGEEASARAKEILTGKTVQLIPDSTQDQFDKYGRSLYYVFLSDGTLFNAEMIRVGYAYEYTYQTPYKYQTQFKAFEREAREQKVGLWAEGRCR